MLLFTFNKCDTEGQLKRQMSSQIYRKANRLTEIFIVVVAFIYVRHAFVSGDCIQADTYSGPYEEG